MYLDDGRTRTALMRQFAGKTEEGQTYLALLLFFRLADDPKETAEKLVRSAKIPVTVVPCGPKAK